MNRNFRLEDLVRGVLGKPVVWGQDDCCLFAGDASMLQRDRDPIAPWRGMWSSRREAYLAIASKGADFAAAWSVVASELGLPEIGPEQATPGDLGLLVYEGVQTLACRIEQGWLARRERGIHVGLSAERAWRVA